MTPPNDRRARGAAGEDAAAAFFRQVGYTIVDRNWRCRFGELDLVAEKDGTLVFAEVRSRSEASLGRFGEPLESITPKKRLTLRRCAEAYLSRRRSAPERVRFDCIGIVLNARNEIVELRHVSDAF